MRPRPDVRETPSDGWILKDEKNYIDWLGCWGIRKNGHEYPRIKALEDYVAIHSKRNDLSNDETLALQYAREKLAEINNPGGHH